MSVNKWYITFSFSFCQVICLCSVCILQLEETISMSVRVKSNPKFWWSFLEPFPGLNKTMDKVNILWETRTNTGRDAFSMSIIKFLRKNSCDFGDFWRLLPNKCDLGPKHHYSKNQETNQK